MNLGVRRGAQAPEPPEASRRPRTVPQGATFGRRMWRICRVNEYDFQARNSLTAMFRHVRPVFQAIPAPVRHTPGARRHV